jgi:hypothetical protein
MKASNLVGFLKYRVTASALTFSRSRGLSDEDKMITGVVCASRMAPEFPQYFVTVDPRQVQVE